MKIKWILFCLSSFSSLLPAALASPWIIGGTSVTSSDWIAHTVVAFVSTSSQGQALCTASLVANDLAITAAHCITDDTRAPRATYTLVFNSQVQNANSSEYRVVDRVEIPQEWAPNSTIAKNTSDVALVHFVGGLPASYVYSDLLPFDHGFARGDQVEIAGYGITSANEQSGAGVLRKTTVIIEDPNYSSSEIDFDQSQGGGACHGDSGGPAYVVINQHPYLFGITSRGGGNCDQDVVYTKIAAYQDWFTQAVAAIRK